MQKSTPQPNNARFQIRPASPEEAGLFYAQLPAEDKRLGAIGHVRMDFGRSGNEFWNTWWPRGPEELNSPVLDVYKRQALDGKGTARQLIESGSGTVTPYGVVYDNGMKLEQVYDCLLYTSYFVPKMRSPASPRPGTM